MTPWDELLPGLDLEYASPPVLELIKEMLEQHINRDDFQCGKGIMPESCTCPDGKSFVPTLRYF